MTNESGIGAKEETQCGWNAPLVCLTLAAIVFAVFGQTLTHDFVDFDDNEYVFGNDMVRQGLTLAGVKWAFTTSHAMNWHPLTWLSHMADCQIYGLNPAGHHLTNVLLHCATVILLFLVLRDMTGAFWRSAAVAAIFAIHPLRVESVAWVSERKDVLSGAFFMLTLMAYVRFVRQAWSWGLYGLVLLLFALGLMAKPMLVSLPCVLLLLDFWPLRRAESILKLLMEKIPLFALSALSCAATVWAEHRAMIPVAKYPLPLRVANAVESCAIYFQQWVWPSSLTVLYPYPSAIVFWKAAVACLFVFGLSLVVWMLRRKQPWLLAGWSWYLVMLLPVLGIVQVGSQAHADRYTYLPSVGLLLAGTWAVAEWKLKPDTWGALVALLLTSLIVCSWKQVSYWRNSGTLWDRALDIYPDNALAHSNFAATLMRAGRVEDAIVHYRKTLALRPDSIDTRFLLARALLQNGNLDEAIQYFNETLKQAPNSPEIYSCLGNAWSRKGNEGQAIVDFQNALHLKPDDPGTENSLAWLLATGPDPALRDGPKAVELAQKANAAYAGKNPFVLRTLAAAYARAGKFEDAKRTIGKAIGIVTAANRQDLAAQFTVDLTRYEASQPFPQ